MNQIINQNDNNVTCYQGIQRVYRNAIVRLLRKSMTDIFPDDCNERLKKPFKKEWADIEQNARISRENGELECEIIDDFDLLSVNHFFNILDVYFYDITGVDKKATGARSLKQNSLAWIRTIKNLRDPLSHPGEENFSFEDSFMLLDCARRVLLNLKLETDAGIIKELMDGLKGAPISQSTDRAPLEDRLPPRESIVVSFVGRDKYLEELREWFDDPVSRRWALSGEGGKGKSAIAYMFGFEIKLSAPKPFQVVVWLSAKKKQFIEGTIVDITSPDFFDLGTAIDKILTYYGWTELLVCPVDTKRIKALELLNEFPALVIVDDIDSLDVENEDVAEFFSFNVPQTKSKVLFTSRRILFGMGRATTHIEGFDLKDTADFVLSRCELISLEPQAFTHSVIDRIHKATEGSPLYIEDLMRLCSVMKIDEAISYWAKKGGKEARRYALSRECEMLKEVARKVLFAACLTKRPISFVELEEILNLKSETLMAAIYDLQNLFLVPKPRLIEGEQRFEVNINTKNLVREVFSAHDSFRRIETTFKRISGEIKEIYSGNIGSIITQSLYLVRADKHLEAEQLLLNALDKYNQNLDIMGVLGVVYKSWVPPRVTDARERFKRAGQMKSKKEDMYVHWAKMEIEQLEWTKASKAAEKGLKVLGKSQILLYIVGYSKTRLGKELIRASQREKADKQFEEALVFLEQAQKIENYGNIAFNSTLSDVYRALVIANEGLNRLRAMNHFLEKWKKHNPLDPNYHFELDRLTAKFGRV